MGRLDLFYSHHRHEIDRYLRTRGLGRRRFPPHRVEPVQGPIRQELHRLRGVPPNGHLQGEPGLCRATQPRPPGRPRDLHRSHQQVRRPQQRRVPTAVLGPDPGGPRHPTQLPVPLGPYYDMACNGGWIDNALYYIILNGGISNYDNYAYVSGNTQRAGTCNPQGPSAGTINDCGATQKNSESDLQAAVAEQGVIGIAIDAGGIGSQLYSGGVYTSNTCSSSRLNHAVTCVGYGTDSGTPYWTVKNSWGTGWGDNGYILMHRNYNNMCGVAATPAYAIAP